MIRASNVFHLLWSDAAAQSPEVRKEWLLALQTNGDARFIRPWYWQEPLVPRGKGHQTYLRALLLVIDHNAYHLGQIVAVRRALGTWQSD